MPEMDGIEFVKKLKLSATFSHVPVLMLTSYAHESDIMKGLETGVDDYLVKPFNSGILRLKISAILTNRDAIRKKLRLDDKAALSVIAENSTDNLMIRKLYDVIEEHMGDSDFGVEQLSREIGMHRSNLSRKVTALLGQSPQDLIKSQRLKHAAKLLLASGKTVSEITYDCGFSDLKSFRKAFKAYFGMLPTEYKETQKDL